MSLTLFHKQGDARVHKLRVAAKYVGLELAVKCSEEELTPLAEKNTLGKLPLLETPQGLIFASNAILRYIARQGKAHGLYGSNIFEMSVIDGWIDWAYELDLPSAAWLYQVLGLTDAHDTETRNMAARDVRDSLAGLNRALVSKTYLVGEQVTLADISVALSLVDLFSLVLDDRFRVKFANVTRWLDTVLAQPNVVEILGAVTRCQSTPGAPLPADILGDDEHASISAVANDLAKDALAHPDTPAASQADVPAVVTDAPAPTTSSPVPDGAISPRPSSVNLTEHKRLSSTSSVEELSHSHEGADTGKGREARGSLTGRPSSSALPVQTSEGDSSEVQHGVSLKPFSSAVKADFELKTGGPEGGVLGLFNKKSKEIWITVNEIKGKLSDDNLIGLQTLLKAEKSTMHKKKTSAYLLFQDQAVADALLAQKNLSVYIQQ